MSARGSSRRWRKLRAYVLERDRYVCQVRGPSCTGRAVDVDHVVPVVLGGTDHPRNLRASCARCNRSAGAGLASVRGRLGPPSRSWGL